MTGSTENLILEHLRAIRGRVDQQHDILMTIQARLTSLATQVANLHGDIAIVHQRVDGMERPLDRIEKRLDLTNA